MDVRKEKLETLYGKAWSSMRKKEGYNVTNRGNWLPEASDKHRKQGALGGRPKSNNRHVRLTKQATAINALLKVNSNLKDICETMKMSKEEAEMIIQRYGLPL